MRYFVLSLIFATQAFCGVGVFVPDAHGNVVVVDSVTLLQVASLMVGDGTGQIISSPNGEKVYVTSQTDDAVYVIDALAYAVLTHVDVGLNPFGLAITSDSAKLFASNQTAGTVSIINTSNNTVLGTTTVGPDPTAMAVSLDDTKVFVCNHGGTTVSVIDTSTYAVLHTVNVGTTPTDILATNFAIFVSNSGSNNVTIFDPSSYAILATATVGSSPTAIALNPARTKLYVANFGTTTVTVVNTTAPYSTETISGLGSNPNDLIVSPDGSKLYVTTIGAGIKICDTSSNTITGTIPAGLDPFSIVLTPDGETAFVTNYVTSGFVTPIDLIDNTAETPIAAGYYPQFLTIASGPSAVTPATSFAGQVVKNRYLTQIDRIHALSWDASTDGDVVGYLLYRNGTLLGNFTGSGPFSYLDHRTIAGVLDTYTLYAYIADGNISAPVTVLLR